MEWTRYKKALLVVASAVVTLLGVLIEQQQNLLPAEWQPWVLFAWQALTALGVRAVQNTTRSITVAANESVVYRGDEQWQHDLRERGAASTRALAVAALTIALILLLVLVILPRL